MDATIQEYNRRLVKIANEFNAKQLNDFAVVIQPYLQNMKIPDLAFLSGFDCFHRM